jgi:hypothetical protein
MTPEEKEQIEKLCKQIETEQDPKKLTELLSKLNDLLHKKRSPRQTRAPKAASKSLPVGGALSGTRWHHLTGAASGRDGDRQPLPRPRVAALRSGKCRYSAASMRSTC